MKYYDPNDVTGPRDFVEAVKVIYDGGDDSFSIAIVNWEGKDHLAMRWNIARREWDDVEKINNTKICVGMPSSHGYPVWFILPPELLDKNSSIFKKIEEAWINLNKD